MQTPQRAAILLRGAKEECTDLLCWAILRKNGKIFLDSHALDEGFVLQNSQTDIYSQGTDIGEREEKELVLEEPKNLFLKNHHFLCFIRIIL